MRVPFFIHFFSPLDGPSLDDDIQDDLRGSLDVQARLLYGLIHARWIITARGLTKMVFYIHSSLYTKNKVLILTFTVSQLDKFKRADFGRCPRVLCASQPLLPVGLTDIPYEKSVKLYCGRCEDLYSPKSSRHGSIDGAYFGTTFPHLLFLVYPTLIPSKAADLISIPGKDIIAPDTRTRRRLREDSEAAIIAAEGGGELINTASVALKAERYRPRIYGFQLSEIAKLQRWQEAVRDRWVKNKIIAFDHY